MTMKSQERTHVCYQNALADLRQQLAGGAWTPIETTPFFTVHEVSSSFLRILTDKKILERKAYMLGNGGRPSYQYRRTDKLAHLTAATAITIVQADKRACEERRLAKTQAVPLFTPELAQLPPTPGPESTAKSVPAPAKPGPLLRIIKTGPDVVVERCDPAWSEEFAIDEANKSMANQWPGDTPATIHIVRVLATVTHEIRTNLERYYPSLR